MRTRFGWTAAAALLLAGCASAAPVSPSVEAAPTASATTAAPVPSPSPTVDCASRGIVPGALNCLVVDQPIEGNPGQDLLVWDPTNCSASEGRWISATGVYDFTLEGQDGSDVGRIDVWDTRFGTPEGIGLGSLKEDLLAAYPGLVEGTPGFATEVYWIEDANGYVVFEVGDWDYESKEPGPDQVVFLRILDPRYDPDFAVYATENIAGVCPIGE